MTMGDLVAAAHAYYERHRDAKPLSGTAMANIPHGKSVAILTRPRSARDHRPMRESREPCPFCQTRGDFGCKHFAPFEEARPV